MSEAIERLLNLALYLADAREPVTAERIRADVTGYPAAQDQAAFLRMFERDKDQLRASGFIIEGDEAGCYTLDRTATFAAPINLTAEETAAIRTAGAAMLSDPSFPYPDDLRLALAKIATGITAEAVPVAARLADENPARQGTDVATLSSAAMRGKRVRFGYTNSHRTSAPHEAEPYGLFLHDGRWYLVARDVARDDVRTYAIARMESVSLDTSRPATRDFERPAGFDVRSFVRRPFQYGPPADEFEVAIHFEPDAAWRASSLAAGQGTLSTADNGAVLWRVRASSRALLLRFVIENGPGLRVVEPAALAADLAVGLAKVARAHA